jgi:hypothetical protein
VVADRPTEEDDRAARELLLALATARSDGDVTTYERLLAEATREPARSLVLIDTFVLLLLGIAKKGASEPGMSREDFLRLLALVIARNGENP